MTKLFLDTSVVIYSLDPRDRTKQEKALAWLSLAASQGCLTISPQVCAETRSVAVRKLGLKHDVARAAIERLLPWCIAPMTAIEVQCALDLADSRKMSWWDALMISSALGAGCTHFLTEDVQSAPEVEGMQIVDPFTTALEAVLKG